MGIDLAEKSEASRSELPKFHTYGYGGETQSSEYSPEFVRQARESFARLVGQETLDYLKECMVQVNLVQAETNAFGKLNGSEVFAFDHLGRVVYLSSGLAMGKYEGVCVDFALNDQTSELDPSKDKFTETREELGSDTLKFLRFMSGLVDSIQGHVLITPSDTQRERIYRERFSKHPHKGGYVFIKDKPILKRSGFEHPEEDLPLVLR